MPGCRGSRGEWKSGSNNQDGKREDMDPGMYGMVHMLWQEDLSKNSAPLKVLPCVHFYWLKVEQLDITLFKMLWWNSTLTSERETLRTCCVLHNALFFGVWWVWRHGGLQESGLPTSNCHSDIAYAHTHSLPQPSTPTIWAKQQESDVWGVMGAGCQPHRPKHTCASFPQDPRKTLCGLKSLRWPSFDEQITSVWVDKRVGSLLREITF